MVAERNIDGDGVETETMVVKWLRDMLIGTWLPFGLEISNVGNCIRSSIVGQLSSSNKTWDISLFTPWPLFSGMSFSILLLCGWSSKLSVSSQSE